MMNKSKLTMNVITQKLSDIRKQYNYISLVSLLMFITLLLATNSATIAALIIILYQPLTVIISISLLLQLAITKRRYNKFLKL